MPTPREALVIEVDRTIDADGVVDVLERLTLTHGVPHYVRFDNAAAQQFPLTVRDQGMPSLPARPQRLARL